MDEAHPLCAFVLYTAGESQDCQQPNTIAKSPLNTFTFTALSNKVGMLQFHVAAADLVLSFCGLKFEGFVRLHFPTAYMRPGVTAWVFVNTQG